MLFLQNFTNLSDVAIVVITYDAADAFNIISC